MNERSGGSVLENPKSKYILGHSQQEIERLLHQAAILGPITERLLLSAGIASGMRVLDLGCGAGDVTMQAGQLVGETGSVLGIDRSEEILALATERGGERELKQIRFQQAEVESFHSKERFDMVIGRYVLMHQADPVEFIRAAARLVKPGGTIAFHEVRLTGRIESLPFLPLWQTTGDLILTGFRAGLTHYDVSERMVACFSDAGLPQPKLFCEIPMGAGADSPFYAYFALLMRSILPQLVKVGIEVGQSELESLESRLRKAAVAARSQLASFTQICAWAKV
jgi:ubiquinone/menaquinone biosynthesis C-methylase UbiE